MNQNYIQAPLEYGAPTYHKGKVRRVKRAKRREVPKEYRKSFLANIKSALHEILWYLR